MSNLFALAAEPITACKCCGGPLDDAPLPCFNQPEQGTPCPPLTDSTQWCTACACFGCWVDQ